MTRTFVLFAHVVGVLALFSAEASTLDVRLVYVHLDLERIHVDDRADSGSREAAAESWRSKT
jgi:hypothetical protein